MSNYPSQLDTDAEIPSVTNNITEVGADVINAIREAIFALQATLGADVHGSASSLKERLDSVLNPDGTFKSAALVAAGLIALPITNSMVGSSAAIEESKLNLDYSTQSLYSLIASNDIDIAALQSNANQILSNFLSHVSGNSFKHDGYQILLDTGYPVSPPPDISPLTATTVSEAIFELKQRFFLHVDPLATGSHNASEIAIDSSALVNITANNLQDAVEQLEVVSETIFIDHRDDLHANGFSNFANTRDGYSASRQLLPQEYGEYVQANILSDRQTIQVDGYAMAAFGVSAGDRVYIHFSDDTTDSFTIEAIGPRPSIGGLPALTPYQFAVAENIGHDDGYVDIAIFSPSSVSTFKGNMAPTVHQSDIRVDSIQVSRPNAARVLSLGINPRFINSTHTLGIEVGVGPGLFRTISIDNLHYNRNLTPASEITLDTIVERINHVLQNRSDGYAFPAAAYRIGDELLLSHNWFGSDDYYVKITTNGSTTTALYVLGFDDYGANIVDVEVRPTHTAHFYVAGVKMHDVATILSTSANVMAQTFTFPNGENPLDLGVKVGHLLHLKTHANTSELGTYFITGVNSSSVVIHKNTGITTENGVVIEIIHDAIPLDELQGFSSQAIIETYYTSSGSAGYRLRADNDLVTNVTDNLHIIDISDNFASGTSTIDVSAAGLGRRISFSNGVAKEIPYDFNGRLSLRSADNFSVATLDIRSPITGTGTITINSYDHILEEEVIELASVWFDGSTTISNISDKRLFGTTGLDELREDVIQAHSELPTKELRSDGVITGFDIISVNYTDAESISGLGSNSYGVLFRGGVGYVDGVRVETPNTPVFFPYEAANYLVYLNSLGNINYIEFGSSESDGYFSLSEIFDGYAGRLAPIATITHTGAGATPISAEDSRFFINNIDDKIEFVLDVTNRRIGNFATFAAAESYINNIPHDSSSVLKLVSNSTSYDITTSESTSDFKLDILGSMGELEINSNMRVDSPNSMGRSNAHMQGLTIGSTCYAAEISNTIIESSVLATLLDSSSKISFKNVTFRGAVSLASNGEINITGCTFTDTSSVILTAHNLSIRECNINSSAITITAESTLSSDSIGNIFGTNFKPSGNFGIFEASSGSLLNIDGCQFHGSGTSKTLELLGSVNVSKTHVTNVAQASGAMITAGSVSVPDAVVTFRECKFDTLTTTSTGKYASCATSDSILNIHNCIFEDLTITNNTAVNIIATKFVRNTVLTAGLNLAISGFDGEVESNVGLSSVQYNTASITDIVRSISKNIFNSTASIGFNITLNNTSSPEHAISVCDNYVTHKVILGDSSARVIINGNIFTGTNPDCGIDFGTHVLASASEPIIVSSNIFSCQTPLVFSEEKYPVQIINNIFDSTVASNTTIRIGDNSIISGNTYLDSTDIIILTSSASNIKILGNTTSGGMRLQGTYTSSEISSNSISGIMHFETSAALSNTIVDSNIFASMYFNTGNTFDDTIFSNNSISETSSSDLVSWQRCTIISNNISSDISGAGTHTFYSGAAGQNNISNNKFKSNISLSAATTIVNCIIDSNIFDNKSITFLQTIEQTSIVGNVNCSIVALGGMDSAAVLSNQIGINDIDIAGIVSNSSINNNIANNINVACQSGSVKLDVSSNSLSGSITLFESADDGYEISNLSITGNNINGSIAFQSHSGASATRAISDTLIASNNLLSLSILTTAASASVTISEINISANNIRQNIEFFSNTGIYNTVNGISISGNMVSGACRIRKGDSTTKNISNLNITGNYIYSDLVVGLNAASPSASGMNLTYATISSNTFETPPALDCSLIDRVTISNNIASQFQIYGEMTNLAISSNTGAPILYIYNSATDISITNNDCPGITLNNYLGASDIVDLVISSNNTDSISLASSLTLSNARISDNSSGTLTLPATITNAYIGGNHISTLFDLDAATVANSIKRLFLFGNNVISSAGTAGEIRFPALTCFAADGDQSKFIANHSYTWTCATTFTATAQDRIYCIGNSSASGNVSTNVEFGANANNINYGAGGGGVMSSS